MTFPTGLFIDSPEVEDVSMHQLGEDAAAWPEEIVQKFKERIPDSAGLSLMVKFMKQDEENGTATGSILVSDSKKQVTIPLIVKDFMMYPLDVMMVDKKLLPLNPDHFASCFSGNETFAKIEEYPTFGGLGRFEDANLWSATYPPSLGRYAYASAGTLLDNLEGTIDGREFRAYLEQNPTLLTNFKKHGHQDTVKKLANLQPVNMNEFRQGVENLIQRPIRMLRKEGPNKYTLLSNSDSVFSPVITSMNRWECLQWLGTELSDHVEDTMNEVDQNGEKMLIPPSDHGDAMLAVPHDDRVEDADQFDHYSVRTRNGLDVEGMVIPKVISFDMKPAELKVFIGKTMGTIQPTIAGVRIENSSFKLPCEDPTPGMSGVFYFQQDRSKALCTIPVTIESVTDAMGEKVIKCQTLLGVTLKLIWGSHGADMLKSIVPHPRGYLLPHGFKWAPMQGFDRVSNSLADYVALGLGHVKSASAVRLLNTGFGQFAIKGLDKYAQAAGWDPTNLHGYQVKFLLTSLGMNQEKIAGAMKTAAQRDQVEIHRLNLIPLQAEKVARAVPIARQLAKTAASLKSNLTKMASFMENSQTVDSMLALNFVNPENVSKFVGRIPQFKGTISQLASCLMASRLGLREIPEQSASTAMQRLVEVVNGLEALRATQGDKM